MLTPADDFPLHQTADPIAFAGTDRNFYDRFFFNGYSADGSVFFAGALGVYPQLDIMDGAFNVVVDGQQYVLRVSKHMMADRLNLQIGPLRVELSVPLKQVRLVVEENDGPLACDLTFTARHFPIEEPRFTRRLGTRTLMDVTRMTQNGRWTGDLSVNGKAVDIGDNCFGTRDRSWGVRPVGEKDPQALTGEPISQFFWIWTPGNFGGHAAFMHTNDDEYGRPWNRRAVVQAEHSDAIEYEDVEMNLTLRQGSQRVDEARMIFRGADGDAELTYKTGTHFYMNGLGYTHPIWGHGMNKGKLAVEHEVINLAAVDDNNPLYMHIQALSRATLSYGGEVHEGFGVVEQLFVGRHPVFEG